MTTLKKTLWFLLASAVIAVGAFLLMDWSKRWNKPPSEKQTIQADLLYQGNPIEVSISCDCPKVFVASQKRELRFDISLVKSRKTARPLTPVPGGEPAPTVATETNKARAANPGPARTIYAWADAVNGTAQLPKDYNSWGIGFDDRLDGGIKASVPLSVTPSGQGPLLVTFHLQAALPNKEFDTVEPGVATWNPEIRSTFLAAVGPLLYSALVFCGALGVIFLVDRRSRQLRNRTEQRLAEARKQFVSQPGETYFAWETARIKLEAYFDRNLTQVSLVFWLAVFVMVIGFGFVLAGVILALNDPEKPGTAVLSALSGIITQFIGATFMVIYRSTMRKPTSI